MLIKDARKCSFITALDSTTLCELLHPSREEARIPYSIAYAVLKPGHISKKHRLKKSSEVYFILEGQGEMHIDNESASVYRDQAIFIPPQSWQYIKNTGANDLRFLCIVNPCWSESDEEIFGTNG